MLNLQSIIHIFGGGLPCCPAAILQVTTWQNCIFWRAFYLLGREKLNRSKVVHIYDVERGWSGANEHDTQIVL
jgi:hypothetical protein